MVKNYVGIFLLASGMMISGFAEIEVNFNGDIKFGAWWIKEWDFTDTLISRKPSQIDTTVDSIFGEDPHPVTNLEILPFGFLGINLKKERLDFCFDLGIGKNIYDFEYLRSATLGQFFVKKKSFFVGFRNFYAQWNFNDAVSLLLGQSITPCNFTSSNQAFLGGNGMNNSGVLETGRRPMIECMVNKNIGNAMEIGGSVAAVMVDTILMTLPTYYKIRDTTVTDTATGQSVVKSLIVENEVLELIGGLGILKANVELPKLEGRIDFNFQGKLFQNNLNLAAGYQKYDIVFRSPHSIDPEENIYAEAELTSYVWGLNNVVSFPMTTIAYSCAGGQNPGIYGVNIGNPFKWRGDPNADIINIFYPYGRRAGYGPSEKDPIFEKGSLIDPELAKSAKTVSNSHLLEMAWIVNIRPWDFIAAEGGFGLVKASHDDPGRNQLWHDSYAWYGQIDVTVSNVLTITPEVGYYYYGPAYHQGKFYYWGLNSQVTF